MGAAGLLPPALLAAGAEPIDYRVVEFGSRLSRSRFAALLQETFFVHTETDGVVAVRLAAIEDRRAPPASLARRLRPARLEQFSLHFEGPALPLLAAGLYSVEHHVAGRTLLNLEPSGVTRYRAAFSLLR
jgi:hypothetical protein